MQKLIISLVIATILLFIGAAIFSDVAINLSAGPEAQGQLALDQANAAQIEALTAQGNSIAAQALIDQKKIDDATRQAKINRANALNTVLKWAGSFALGFALIFTAINAMAFFGAINYRLTIKPVFARSGAQVAWTMPLMPFMLIHTTDDAPSLTTLFEPGEPPKLTASPDMPFLALSRALLGDGSVDRMDQMGNIAQAFTMLSQILEGIPVRSLKQPDRDGQ